MEALYCSYCSSSLSCQAELSSLIWHHRLWAQPHSKGTRAMPTIFPGLFQEPNLTQQREGGSSFHLPILPGEVTEGCSSLDAWGKMLFSALLQNLKARPIPTKSLFQAWAMLLYLKHAFPPPLPSQDTQQGWWVARCPAWSLQRDQHS